MALVVPDQSKTLNEGRDRAVDQAALPQLSRTTETIGSGRRGPPGRAVARAQCGRTEVRRRWRRGIRGRARVLPPPRAQEIQGARPCVPQSLSRVSDVSGVRRDAASARSPRRPRRRPDDRRGLRPDGATGARLLFDALAQREGRCRRRQDPPRDLPAPRLPH
jgi:hypothetical protein